MHTFLNIYIIHNIIYFIFRSFFFIIQQNINSSRIINMINKYVFFCSSSPETITKCRHPFESISNLILFFLLIIILVFHSFICFFLLLLLFLHTLCTHCSPIVLYSFVVLLLFFFV